MDLVRLCRPQSNKSVARVKRSVTRVDPTYFRVRYSEIDGQRVVFNAHYLTYFDTTIDYFRCASQMTASANPPYALAYDCDAPSGSASRIAPLPSCRPAL